MTTPHGADRINHTGPFNVVSWNILLDKTRSSLDSTDPHYVVPQQERVPSLSNTLESLPISLDVVGLSEVHLDNGTKLAHMLGYSASYWYEHNTNKRKDEHIGMFGNLVTEEPEMLELGDNRRAVITYIGSVAVAQLHLRYEPRGKKREKQMTILLERLEDEDKAVMMGDYNALWFEKVRRNIRQAGFEAAFEVSGQQSPPTYPAPGYEGVVNRYSVEYFSRIPRGLDQIYVKGVGVGAAKRFAGDTDHYGLWAKIDPGPNIDKS